MPTSKPCFRVVLTEDRQKYLKGDHLKKEMERIANDAKLRVTAKTFEFDYAYDDFAATYPMVRKTLDDTNRDGWHTKYATEEYKLEMANKLDDSRDHYRDFAYPQLKDPGLGGGMDGRAGTQQVMKNSPGMVLANDHSDQHTKDLMVQALDDQDIGILFIEEFQVGMQPYIDEFLDSPSDEFPPELQSKLNAYQGKWEVDFAPLLLKAKKKGCRVYGIDSAEAHYVNDTDPRHHESRCAVMNEVSEKVMKEAIRKHPGKKFVAMCGAAHATTHEGGIPGLSEIMGVPSVKVSPTGVMTHDPENPKNRVMPSKDVQAFADKFALQVVAAYEKVKQGGNDPDENIDQIEVKVLATKLAADLQASGRLKSPKDIAKLLSATDVMDAQNKIVARTKARRDKRKQFKQLIDAGDHAQLGTKLDQFKKDDPYGFSNEREMTGSTLLHYSAEKGQVDCIESLVTRGANLEEFDAGHGTPGMTPLHKAAKAGHAAAIEKLLSKGANPNIRTKKSPKQTAMHYAATAPGDGIKKLIAGGASPHDRDSTGKTPLHIAAESGQPTAAKDLLANGAIGDATDADGNSALHHAALNGATTVITELVSGGVSLNNTNNAGETALHSAARGNKPAALTQLAGTKGVQKDKTDATGGTALHLAAELGFSGSVDALADAGVSLDLQDLQGNTPLHRACGSKDAKTTGVAENLMNRYLIAEKSIETANNSGESPMHRAGRAGNLDTVKDLANSGAGVTHKDKSGATALDGAFVERFRVEANKKYNTTKGSKDPALEDREITEVANKLAKTMIGSGLVSTMDDVNQLPASKTFTDEIDKLIERTKKRAGEFAKAVKAISDGKDADLDQLLRDDPGLKYFADPTEQQTLLHVSARRSNGRCIDVLATHGADLNAPDKDGNTPAICAVYRRRDQDQVQQANALKVLLDKGANFDAQNKQGQTAMHLAAWNGNAPALKQLFAKGADTTKKDNRGWTAQQTAQGSTKVAAENAFYEADPTLQTELVKDGQHSTIDILMQATTCENPAHLEKIRKTFETLYANEMVRPILDLVALDAAGKRQPPKGGARIFIADSEQTGDLWNSAGVNKTGARGAYDEGANVVMVGAKKTLDKGDRKLSWDAETGDLAGCLVHEMTHLAAHIVYGDKVEPFAPNTPSETNYKKAITEDMKNCHSLCSTSKVESGVRDRMVGRMDHYVSKPNAEHELMMEYIVNIPQISAEFGPDAARKYMPEMAKFFDDFTKQCDTVGKGPKFTTARQRVDTQKNQQLATKLEKEIPPPKLKEEWIDQKDASPTALLNMVKQEFIMKHGAPKLPTGVSVPFKPEHFALKDPEQKDLQKELDKKLAVVKKTLEKNISASGLPPEMSADDLRAFVTETTTLVETTKEKDLDKALSTTTNAFIRESKIRYVDHGIAEKKYMPTECLAEAAILKAEKLARGGAQDDLVEVDQKKHRELVASLAKKMNLLPPEKFADPGKIVTQLTSAMSNGKTGGVYKAEKPIIGKANPNKVVVDKKAAKRGWLQRLKTI